MSDEEDLLAASRSNDAARVRSILGRNPLVVRARSAEGTPLLVARRHGAEDALRVILAATQEDQLSLYEAAAVGNERRLKTILGQSRWRLNEPNVNGDTALGLAAAAGHVEAVKVLLEHGADPNGRTAEGKTPLSVSMEKGHAAVADILRSAGTHA